jgi:hypothetical protein
MADKQYLGDAVEASFDGEYIVLETSDTNHQRIYLDLGVFRNLLEYAEAIGWSTRPESQR